MDGILFFPNLMSLYINNIYDEFEINWNDDKK